MATGELTQRIGEIVLDGSDDEAWKGCSPTNDSVISFLLDLDGKQNSANFTNNKMINKPTWNANVEGIWADCNIILTFKRSTLTTNDLTGARQWLSQNPITVQYELATESIKTVDLSDNVVYSFGSTTHYSCSCEEGSLVPTLSVKVPTDTQLTIQEQKATTQTLLIKNMDLQQSIKEVQAMNLAFNTVLYNSFNSIREEVEDIKKHVSTNENLEGSF